MNKKTVISLFSLILFAIFMLEIIFLLWACKRHLDFTDESFYVLSSLYPEQFTTRFSDFGYLNAIVMSITGKNLYFLRISALVILLMSSFGVVYQSLLYTEKELQTRFSKKERYIWILTGMIASTGYYFWGITTPSYNFYALIGILISSSSFLAIINHQKYKPFHIFLLPIGLLILYTGKPTPAAFFVFCLGIWILFAPLFKKLQFREIIRDLLWSAGVFSVLFFLHIQWIYGSIGTYFSHIREVQQLLSKAGYSSNGLKNNILNSIAGEWQKFYFLIPYAVTMIVFIIFHKKTSNTKVFSSFVDKGYFYAVGFFIVFGGFFSYKGISWKWAWGYMAILYAVISYSIFYTIRIKQEIKNLFLFILFIFLISLSYVFGTNNSFSMALAGIYIAIAASLMYLSARIYHTQQNFIPVITSIFLIALFSVSTLGLFFMHPYRSEFKLHQHRYKLDVLGSIYTDKFHFEYVRQLQEIAKSHPEIQQHEFLVDISGKSGVNLILSKKYLGQSWIVWGKTDTYYHFANSILKNVPLNKLQKAILLTNEAIPTEKILKDLSLNFPDNYSCIGKVQTMPEKEHHLLWIPK
jgi:hypothetical protein